MGNFDKKLEKFWEIFIDHGGYIKVLTGLQNTLIIAIVGLALGILIGTVIAIIRVMPKYRLLPRILNGVCVFMWDCFGERPSLYSFCWRIMCSCRSSVSICRPFKCVSSSLVLTVPPMYPEIMRSGILSVDPGRMEAGRALGLSYRVTMLKIVVPQAVKNILPTLGNEFISLIKETPSSASSVRLISMWHLIRYRIEQL